MPIIPKYHPRETRNAWERYQQSLLGREASMAAMQQQRERLGQERYALRMYERQRQDQIDAQRREFDQRQALAEQQFGYERTLMGDRYGYEREGAYDAAQLQAMRDARLYGYDVRGREQAGDIAARAAETGFGYEQALADQRFGQQLDLTGYEAGIQAERDARQFGYDQWGVLAGADIQAERDTRMFGLESAGAERDALLQARRDEQLFGYDQLGEQQKRLLDREDEKTRFERDIQLGDLRFLDDMAKINATQSFQLGLMDRERAMEDVRAGRAQYTPRQKQEIARLNDAIAQIRSNRNLSPQQKSLALWEARQRLMDIENSPTEVPLDERPIPLSKQFELETHEDKLGRRWARDPNGAWKMVADAPEKATPADQYHVQLEQWGKDMDRWAKIETLKAKYIERETKPDDEGNPRRSIAEVAKEADRLFHNPMPQRPTPQTQYDVMNPETQWKGAPTNFGITGMAGAQPQGQGLLSGGQPVPPTPPAARTPVPGSNDQAEQLKRAKAGLPAPTPEQLAKPVPMPPAGQESSLPHGAIVEVAVQGEKGPVSALLQWNAKEGVYVEIERRDVNAERFAPRHAPPPTSYPGLKLSSEKFR